MCPNYTPFLRDYFEISVFKILRFDSICCKVNATMGFKLKTVCSFYLHDLDDFLILTKCVGYGDQFTKEIKTIVSPKVLKYN